MPKTIKIFLIDGEPNGLKTAELSNWTGKAIVFPRNKLKEVKDLTDVDKPSIYFLFGKENEADLLYTAYIGEAENLFNRLYSHDSSKDFWQIAVAFVSKDDNLTKAHVRYLESRCINIANNAKRFRLENSVESSLPSLSHADVAEMEEFLENLKLLLSALGFQILQELLSQDFKSLQNSSKPVLSKDEERDENSSLDTLFTCKGKGALARGRIVNDGFIVYKGSTVTTIMSKAVVDNNLNIIEKLIKNNYLQKKDDSFYIFTNDYVFNSPSAAANVILGNSSNGLICWKNDKGQTIKKFRGY